MNFPMRYFKYQNVSNSHRFNITDVKTETESRAGLRLFLNRKGLLSDKFFNSVREFRKITTLTGIVI